MSVACLSESESKKIHNEIEKLLKEDKKKLKYEAKLLLLGAGESGKTTILRQMKIIHDKGFSDEEKDYYKEVVFSNLMTSARSIILGMEKLSIDIPESLSKEKELVREEDAPFNSDAIRKIWGEPVVKEAVNRSNEYQLIDSAVYFLDSLDRIISPEYIPTTADILRTRVKTTGITESKFKVGDLLYTLVDVGGQRSERRKWVHCFENVTAIIFVVAVSAYDQNLIEDESVNRMTESITVFEQICNAQWFTKTSMIVFLNKIDILKTKLSKSRIADYFPEFQWANTYKEAITFFTEKFQEVNHSKNKHIYFHETCATDTSQIQFVMAAVNDIIIQKNLQHAGLV